VKKDKSKTIVFLDRDGTINENFSDAPVYEVERFRLLPDAARAIRILNDLGLKVVVATNQGGIQHGEIDFDWETYRVIEEKMHEQLREEADARVDRVLVSPNASYENSPLRKPGTGLFEQAAAEYDFDPAASYMIGDRETDILAGNRFGLQTILVESGWEKDVLKKCVSQDGRPDFVVRDLLEAVEHIRAQYE